MRTKKEIKTSIIILITLISLILLITPLIISQDEKFDTLISNSEKWQDVFSVLYYANLKGLGAEFLVSTNHGPLLLNDIGTGHGIRVITSKDSPYIFNYPDIIKSRNYPYVDEIIVENANLELVEDLDVKNFIIVGDSYGFNAIAVVPYGVLTKSWIFLANKKNIYQIDSIMQKKGAEKVLIYGYVDREVRQTLSKYNPEIIDNQDKFKDNIEIVKKISSMKGDIKQVILTNGEFIEKEIMKGNQPILFTGKENVPDQIRDYIKNSNIVVGVLIGNDLVGAATNIRRSTGISVMVKFARGARAQAGGISPVEGLDLFPLPKPYLSLSIKSIRYNKATSQLEVTYKSDSNVPVYLKGTITLISDGERIKIGDTEGIFIGPGDYKTILYSINLSVTNSLKAEVYTLFGESKSSLDRILQAVVDVEIINVLDRCIFNEKNILSLKYNKQKNRFIIRIFNDKDFDCWISLELNNLFIGFIQKTLTTKGPILIKSKEKKNIEIEEELTDEDLEKNSIIDLTLYSGEREDSLVNVFKGKFPLKIETLTTLTYVIIAISLILLILIILIILLIIKKRKEDEED